MNKTTFYKATVMAIMAAALILPTSCNGDKAMTKKNGVYQVNTTTLCPNVMGYNGPTPLLIHIKDNKIQRIEALENNETPRFFEDVRDELLVRWNGLSVEDALKSDVDAVSGCTFSSEAVIQNVRLGLTYYLHKQKQ